MTRNITDLVITGVTTEVCVQTTATDGTPVPFIHADDALFVTIPQAPGEPRVGLPARGSTPDTAVELHWWRHPRTRDRRRSRQRQAARRVGRATRIRALRDGILAVWGC